MKPATSHLCTNQPPSNDVPAVPADHLSTAVSGEFDHLILFDGLCHFCSNNVRLVIKHDLHQRFKFAPIQSELGKKLLRHAHLDPDDVSSMVLITPRGALLRSDAALETARLLGGIWRISAVLRLLPRCWRDRLYHAFATRRYAWFGQSDACFVPTDQIKERFLE